MTLKTGKTHRITVGEVTVYVTVNSDDNGDITGMLAKADHGWQGWLSMLITTANLAIKNGCKADEILRSWLYSRFAPDTAEISSIPDAIARRVLNLKKTKNEEKEAKNECRNPGV